MEKKPPKKPKIKLVKKDIPKAVVSEETKMAFKRVAEKARHRATEEALKNIKNELIWIQTTIEEDGASTILMEFNGKRFSISEGEMVSL